MKKVIISAIMVMTSSCTNLEKSKLLKSVHIKLELMVIPENSQNKRLGYAILGKIQNSLKKNIAFPSQVFQIEYQNDKMKWEKIYSDVYFIGMYSKGFHPYESEEMDSFRKYNKDDAIIKDIIRKIDFPIDRYNIEQVRISSVYYSLLKKDSTMLFSRSVDDYLDYPSDFFKRNIKKGNYRFFFRNREEPYTLKLKDKKDEIKKVEISNTIGDFDVINQSNIVSDTLFIRIW